VPNPPKFITHEKPIHVERKHLIIDMGLKLKIVPDS
jgi:hypothetical protein